MKKAQIVMKFQTDSKHLLKFFHLSGRFMKYISRIYHSYLEIESIHQGGLIFFQDKKSLDNFFIFADNVASKVPKKESEKNASNEKNRLILEILDHPDDIKVQKYVDWAENIALKSCGYVKIKEVESSNSIKFNVEFTIGSFFKILNRVSLDEN